VIGRERGISQSKVRSRRREPFSPTARGGAQAGHKGLFSPRPDRQPADLHYQAAIRNFELGVRAIHQQNYDKAAEIFAKLVGSEARDVAERAHVHLRLCRQKTGRSGPFPNRPTIITR